MDLEVRKDENDFSKNEMFIKTEPHKNLNEFLMQDSNLIENTHRNDIKTEMHQSPKIKSDSSESKDEVKDLAITNHVSAEDITLGENQDHPLEIDGENSQEAQIELNRENAPSKNELTDKSENKYKCDECGKTFYFKYNLKVHLRTHSSEKPYKCDICEKSFSHKNNLNRHMFIHTGLKPFKCDMCYKTFNEKSNFLKHKLTHSGYKPYCCDQCERKFSDKRSLVNHKKLHSGEKPYTCEECDKTFTEKSNLTRHKQIHMTEKAFNCDMCKQTFRYSYNLKQHKKRMHSFQKVGMRSVDFVTLQITEERIPE